jgi:ATP-dependent helicase/nuclease subunit B
MDDRKFETASPSDLDDKTLVLTVNERLSRWLLLQHNRREKKSGKQIWVTPSISSLESWTRELWHQSWSKKHILNEAQSQNLWENIIRKDFYTEHHDLLHLRGAAKLAGQAYQLVKQYRLPESKSSYAWTEESKAFYRWKKSYEQRLHELTCFDSSSLLDELILIQKSISHLIPDQIIFAGFDEINPQFDKWLQFLESKNILIRFLKNFPGSSKIRNLKNDDVHVRAYSDRSQEIIQCARWIRSIYSTDKTIGIVVPDLETYRPVIDREFRSELSPQAKFPWSEAKLPFNISQGTPLKNESAINLATLIISSPSDFIPYKTFYSILTSPFIKGSKIESSGRRLLEKFLRKNNVVRVFSDLIYHWENTDKIPQLIVFLKFLENFLRNDTPVLPSNWAKRISILLKQLGWPYGDEDENNTLYPLLEKWNECLDIFASLDQIIGKVTRHKAIETLNKIIEVPFRKKSPEEPIQVIGMLESSGLEFDFLWVMGCDRKNIPAPPSPNPFIPMNLQKKYNLPHSTAERELSFAQQFKSRILQASPQIVFSFAQWEDNNKQHLSPLLASIRELNPTPTIEQSHAPALQIQYSSSLELFEDQPEIPISQEELHFIKGGHSLVGNMAMCPFRSFAMHRLHTQKMEDPELDIDASKRGDLVHAVMELFWKEVETQANLQEIYDKDELVSQVRKNVDDAIKKNHKHFFHQPKFSEMETQRITFLILDWLQFELSRPPFEVLDTEKQIKLKIDELNLNLKIDRVDKTELGETVIIDYKTGKPNLAEWFQDRLTQPQLPLYSQDSNASAILYAVIKKNNCAFKGIANSEDLIPDIKHDIYKRYTQATTWDDQMNLWEKNIDLLVKNFIAGKLSVDPVDPKTTCKYCGLHGLCKIGEQETFEVEDSFDG